MIYFGNECDKYSAQTMDESSVTNNNSLPQNFNSEPGSLVELNNLKRGIEGDDPLTSLPKRAKNEYNDIIPSTKPHSSPKKKIEICSPQKPKNKFVYGNYNRYYGYRIQQDFHDLRLDIFQANKELFADKEILDIGCNSGFVTIEIAKKMDIKHISGIDIDKGLINRTIKSISKLKKSSTNAERTGFPFNISFVHGNYVLRDDILLEIENPQFDLILCLSVTKWIHLNFGDDALKQAFKRMYAQLRPGGSLILEPQPWEGYKRRKKLTPEIFKNYQAITFKPKDFTDYLLGKEIGFKSVTLLAVPDHKAEGFRRPIQLFLK